MERFIKNYRLLPSSIRARLVIENDERLYSVDDCQAIHQHTKIPVILDVFHHSLYNHDESLGEVLATLKKTWKDEDGLPMVDYSSQQEGKRPGAHAEHIVPEDFRTFLMDSWPYDFDLMLEIKDKEKSANTALALAAGDPRIVTRDASPD